MTEACPQPSHVNSCYVPSLLLERQTSQQDEKPMEAPSAASHSSVCSWATCRPAKMVQLRTQAIAAHIYIAHLIAL